MGNWLRITNPRTGETYIFDLSEVSGSSKTKGRMRVFFKDGRAVVMRAKGKAKWLEDAWKEFQTHTIGVPVYWASKAR